MGVVRETAKRWLPPPITDFLRHALARKRDPVDDSYQFISDAHLYQPVFNPWLGLEPFAGLYEKVRASSLVAADACWVLYNLAKQSVNLPGDIWEVGVYRGGTAALLRTVLAESRSGRLLRLFDTFEGMPATDPARDLHKKGDFADTSLEQVRASVGDDPWIVYHKGFVPETFTGLQAESIAFAHIDVDLYRSILDSCEFIYPRMVDGGFMVFDDYGFRSCPGARQAVDEFFAGKLECPLALPTGQAVVFKAPAHISPTQVSA